jgi:hypothetical protein
MIGDCGSASIFLGGGGLGKVRRRRLPLRRIEPAATTSLLKERKKVFETLSAGRCGSDQQ